jgi:tRNA pseudouridine55 synthase
MIHAAIKKFEGTIKQTPPFYSALKFKGIPLYRYARRGTPVQKPPRRVHIASIQPLGINLPFVTFEVCCSAGTYIRTLCADIGNALDCGGHLKELRRNECCGFSIDDAVTLNELEKLVLNGGISEHIFSMADALRGIPTVAVDEILASKIKQGVQIQKKELNPRLFQEPEGFLKFINTDNQLIAVMKHTQADDRLHYCCVFPN